MPGIAISRSAIFCNRHKQAWISLDAQWDYYNIICSFSLATLLIGVEYVWKKSRHNLQKNSVGWEWRPKSLWFN